MKLSSKSVPGSSTLGSVPADWKARGLSVLPGLLLTTLIAGVAIGLGRLIGLDTLNPLLIAVLLGIGWRQWGGVPATYRPGIKFAMKRVLRLAVILLGLRLSLAEVMAIGPWGLGMVTLSTLSTFYLTCWLGRCLGVNPRLTRLIGAGTSICGASAVVATNTVIEGTEEDMAYAIATITGFGTLAMLIYPLMGSLLHLSPQAFGIWCGASVHEVAQVIAIAFQNSDLSGNLATVTKLSRVLLMVPIVVSLGWQTNRTNQLGQSSRSVPVPWFVLCFCALVVVNSLGLIDPSIRVEVLNGNQFLLCLSLAAMGLETNLASLTKIGLKPIYLAGLSWLFLAVFSLLIISRDHSY
ncbi:YeiH family putative sulfate export transporter [Nodosilinea sp. LEGE 06152]|uniref:YeiH family protein n=1 Tax=Nodosilinea sp. LEGE 06152 TaxID=2777966 RepID=UPI0018800507|nr:YeiH family protein [Nodosilinea sp. LEGE 06152]MBE9159892.1 YeiH family putative sulfate export transporter [Nodosilinea sp. LEGE 06152]